MRGQVMNFPKVSTKVWGVVLLDMIAILPLVANE